MAAIELCGIFCLCVLFIVAYSYLSKSPWKRLPPGPYSFPVIGSLPSLGGDIRKVYSKMAQKYGDVFMYYEGPRRVVVLNGYDVIKEAFLKTPHVYDGRSDMFKDIDNNTGIISSDGPIWKVQRAFITHTLRNFGLGGRSMSQLILEEAHHLQDELRAASGRPYNPHPLLMKAVSNIISVILFGRRFDYSDEEFVSFLAESHRLSEILGADNPALLFRALRYLPGDMFGVHKLKTMMLRFDRRWDREIEARRDKLLRGEEVSRDLISQYLQQISSWREYGDEDTFGEHLVHVIGDMFSAGSKTTSSTLVWALLYMILHPQIQSKVQAEIEAVIGSDRDPSLQDRQHMPYTEAVLSEVQRLGDLVPLAVPHCTLEDTELRGFTIPKGTMILPNLNSVHWNPELWPQPHKFDPRRFLSDDGKYRKREHLIPFSLGKRACLGEQLAKMELFLFFTCLLQKFTFSVPQGHPPPPAEGVMGMTHNAKDFNLIINRR